ncbi:MAG TPA: DEAD/DEAH box helicase [Thiobacillus sp.]|nr:DEAD/DEAH box helicase [Thiobacillus sp.]
MTTETLSAGPAFTELGLAEPILRAVADTGYTTPTPIQAQAIPQVLAGGDLLAAAQTGTGKTAGFTLPILHHLSTREVPAKPGRPRCLILVPTRELAAQVEESVKTYGKYLSLSSMVMFGGVNINPQFKALKSRVDILVATPGRLLDHMGQKTVDLSGVEILVLDEADRMLDMGFIRDIKKVLAVVPKQRQTLLFSATFSDEIRTLANGLLHNPKSVEVARRNTAVEVIEQSMHRVPQAHKRDLLAHLIKHHDWQQVLVFTRTKHGANKLAEKLIKDGISAAAIHGNKSQSARTKALASFKDGSVRVLVATDIAARGIDIDQLPQVVNFELPNVPEDYVHRIGRTGRAGATGSALSLVDDEEMSYLRDIEKLIKRAIVRVEVDPGFVPPAKHELMSDKRPPRQPQGRGAPRQNNGPRQGQSQGRGQSQGQGQPGSRSAAGRAPQGQGKPSAAAAKPSPKPGPQPAAHPKKPRPQAALFSSKPGSRGH